MNVEDFASQPSARFLKVVDVAGREGVGADVAAAGDGASLADAEVGGSGGEGKLVAYGKWNVPTLYARTGQLVSGGDDPDAINEEMWPEGGDRGLATDFFGELARRRSRIMSLGDGKAQGMRPHAYLEIVCTLPEWQGESRHPLLFSLSFTQHACSSPVYPPRPTVHLFPVTIRHLFSPFPSPCHHTTNSTTQANLPSPPLQDTAPPP